MSTAPRLAQALVTSFVFSTPTVTNFTIDNIDPMLSWCANLLHHYLFQCRIAECTSARAALLFTATLPKFYPRVVYYPKICTLLGMHQMAVKTRQQQRDIITTSAAVPSTKSLASVFNMYHSWREHRSRQGMRAAGPLCGQEGRGGPQSILGTGIDYRPFPNQQIVY